MLSKGSQGDLRKHTARSMARRKIRRLERRSEAALLPYPQSIEIHSLRCRRVWVASEILIISVSLVMPRTGHRTPFDKLRVKSFHSSNLPHLAIRPSFTQLGTGATIVRRRDSIPGSLGCKLGLVLLLLAAIAQEKILNRIGISADSLRLEYDRPVCGCSGGGFAMTLLNTYHTTVDPALAMLLAGNPRMPIHSINSMRS